MSSAVATLKKTSDFKKVFNYGGKAHEEQLSLFYSPHKDLRIGIMISRKEGKAVARNRAKRLIKEFFRLNQEKIIASDIVVIVRKPLLGRYYETSSIMLKLLRKAGLMK